MNSTLACGPGSRLTPLPWKTIEYRSGASPTASKSRMLLALLSACRAAKSACKRASRSMSIAIRQRWSFLGIIVGFFFPLLGVLVIGGRDAPGGQRQHDPSRNAHPDQVPARKPRAGG